MVRTLLTLQPGVPSASFEGIIGESEPMQEIFRTIEKVASPTRRS
jgi:transcriptional regulator with GAF, ATPase, and Fis domain